MPSTSSVGVNLSSCTSGPHSSTTTTAEDASRMRTDRLASVSQQGTDNFTDRLYGTATTSDHQASLEMTVAALTATINSSTTTNGS
ncbi:uncharacterized protein GGS22DRAFT_116529 [Annulohypoxylon maeteangense]|uniref:uncharacterized protein n=1 Tax=Annulohypoxylon maeteangense TaxID=1927788 RepID=UPI0020085CB0|nr:uncharacterized protein GGS22DRAFT_116529 [Annulohypoxylon maeteangense]KAI0886688.1 hypothetical protein GGS22DRAFT_116529 [Annulohypoxylon maeteangense]